MGIAPIFAIRNLYKYLGVENKDIDIVEMNEAFASQSIYCLRELGLDMDKVNPNGGAIALGHPVGATGARQVATLLAELKKQDKEMGIVSMCARYVLLVLIIGSLLISLLAQEWELHLSSFVSRYWYKELI